MEEKAPETPAQQGRKKKPPTPRPGSLKTLTKVREEMARLYRDARQGKTGTLDAYRLAFILQSLARIIPLVSSEGVNDGWEMCFTMLRKARDEATDEDQAQVEEAAQPQEGESDQDGPGSGPDKDEEEDISIDGVKSPYL